MVAGADKLADLGRLLLEIRSLEGRIRWIAWPIDDYQLETLRERPHRFPGRGAVPDAPVNKDDPRPASDCLDVKLRHERTIDGRAGEAGTASRRHCKQCLSGPLPIVSTWKAGTGPKIDGSAGKAGTASRRHRKRRRCTWLRPTALRV